MFQQHRADINIAEVVAFNIMHMSQRFLTTQLIQPAFSWFPSSSSSFTAVQCHVWKALRRKTFPNPNKCSFFCTVHNTLTCPCCKVWVQGCPQPKWQHFSMVQMVLWWKGTRECWVRVTGSGRRALKADLSSLVDGEVFFEGQAWPLGWLCWCCQA